jgi:hypothetical protein
MSTRKLICGPRRVVPTCEKRSTEGDPSLCEALTLLKRRGSAFAVDGANARMIRRAARKLVLVSSVIFLLSSELISKTHNAVSL